MKSEAMQEGYNEFSDYLIEENPYEKDSEEYIDWEYGWKQAEIEHDKTPFSWDEHNDDEWHRNN